MQAIHPAPLLKVALIADALACAPLGLLQVALPDMLSKLLQLPAPLLTATGIFLLGYTLLLVVLASSKSVWRALVGIIVLGNVGWAAGCLALSVAAPFTISVWGTAYLAVQAVAVLALAYAEFAGLKSSTLSTGKHDGHAHLAQGR
jgi:hypothetical protein